MDFERISAALRIHFCPQCKASFGCEPDEDGDCDCVGIDFGWKKPWCPSCVEQERCTCYADPHDADCPASAYGECGACPMHSCDCDDCRTCKCADCREERRGRIENQMKSIQEAFMQDLNGYIGRKV